MYPHLVIMEKQKYIMTKTDQEYNHNWEQACSRYYERQILLDYGKYLRITPHLDDLLSFEETERITALARLHIPAPWFFATVLFKDMWKAQDFLSKYVQYKTSAYYLSTIDGKCMLRKYRIQDLSVLNLRFPFEVGDGLLLLTSSCFREQVVLEWYELRNKYYLNIELSNSNIKQWPPYYRK